jgi:hypothetical protein
LKSLSIPHFALTLFSPYGIFIFLGLAIILLTSLIVVPYALYRLVRFRKISLRLGIVALLTLPVFWNVLTEIFLGGEDINPQIDSREQLIGLYSNGDQSLKLNADGTFEAHGLFKATSGKWSNRDWSLTLSNTGLEEPRVITVNGHFCIVPFYAGVDADMGVILRKESD